MLFNFPITYKQGALDQLHFQEYKDQVQVFRLIRQKDI